MGTKVQSESYFPGCYSMRNFTEDSNGASWHTSYGDKTMINGQYYNGFSSRTIVDGNLMCEMDAVKQKMLEHEALFKSQVYELHRLYKVQRDLMNEIRNKELSKTCYILDDSSLFSNPLVPQIPHEEVQGWHASKFPLVNSMALGPSVSIAEDTRRSNLSFIKDNNSPGNQNGDCEILESRPIKVRRKMFDLELPADEYIDIEENDELNDKKVPEISDLFFRSKNGLADLNEPFQIEEGNTSDSHDILGNISVLKPQFLGLPTETSIKYNRVSNEISNNLQMGNKGNGREWMSYMLEAGNSKINLRSGSQSPQPFHSLQAKQYKVHELQNSVFTDQSKEELRKERRISDFNYLNPVMSTNLTNPFSHSVPSLENPFSRSNQQSMPIQTYPSFNFSSIKGSNSGFGGKVPHSNGFYHGSSSGSKLYFNNRNIEHINHTSTNCFNGSNDKDVNSEYHINWNKRVATQKSIGIKNGERKHEDHLNVLPWLHNKTAPPNQILSTIESEKGLHKSFPPIISTNSCSRDVTSRGIDLNNCPTSEKILGFSIFEISDDCKNTSQISKSSSASLCSSKGKDIDLSKDIYAEVVEKREEREVASLRHEIDLNSCISEDEDLLTPSISRGVDLEIPAVVESEEDPLSTVQSSQQISECLNDDLFTVAAEAIVAISSSSCCKEGGNDTFIPKEEDSIDPLHWFVDVVSSCADDLERGKSGNDKDQSSLKEIDYFEFMTLKLTEVNTEEYLSEFLVQENPKNEEIEHNLLNNGSRKGQRRVGRPRQRRDFQRDILPGLASLSRHEVTEDIQTIGGLMKATGQTWHSWSTRRNGCGRGRRRSVVVTAPSPAAAVTGVCSPVKQRINGVENGLEDRNLTGWGKTTRRPRRQRCPAGNPTTSIPLS